MGDPVTAVANALGGLFGTLKPVVEEHFAQKYENQHRDRIGEMEEILAEPDSVDRASKLARFVERLCTSAGTPCGDVSGTTISIPVSHLRTLLTLASENIRDDQRLARITFKQ
jgi:hypothetical protein